jgi:S-DNA-T family DNA segregation ATPase FtsK/SpoIIIE
MPTGRPDGLSAIGATALARRLAGHRSPAGHRIGPGVRWDSESGLQGIPIGTTVGGEPLELDIREAALAASAHRPVRRSDGLGNRNSAHHRTRDDRPAFTGDRQPDLIDFKGGATFLDLARAPHTTAVVTNLDEEAHLVDRMRRR